MKSIHTSRSRIPRAYGPLLATILTASMLEPARADYATEVLSEDPLAYYRFDDGVVTDDQPTPEINLGSLGAAGDASLSGTLVRQVTGALAGSSNVAARTAGNGFTVPYTAGLNFQGSFSAEVWLKPSLAETPGLTCAIASWRENTDTFGREGWLIYQGAAATGFNFRTYNKNGAATAVSINSGAGVTADAWHHVVVTWDEGAAVGKIYVNGVLKATSPVIAPGGTNSRTFDANSSSGFTLGSRSDNAFAWAGDVDEPAYYAGTVLSDAEVLAHYNNGINPTPSPAYDSLILAKSPAGYWRMDDNWMPRTPPVADNAGTLGASADGSYFAGSRNTSSGPAPSSGFVGFGAGNSALSLASANGHVGTGLSLLNGRSAYTVMGWVKRGAVVSTRGGYFGQNDVLEFGDAGTGTQIEAWNSTVGGVTTDAPYPFAQDQWGFIAYTADATGAKLFIDGEQVKAAAGNVGVYGSSDFNFNIGGGGIFGATGDFFLGEIDEVAMLDKALTPARVRQLYDSALGTVAPGLVDTFPLVSPVGEVTEGQSYTLSIDPTGTPPFTYQWKLDGVDIPGANQRTYEVLVSEANTPPFDPYRYTVVVSNGIGTPVTSDEVEVYVSPALRWTGSDGVNPAFWDVGVTTNWETFTGAAPSTYGDEYAVVFDDSATSTTIELQQDLAPAGMVISNETQDLTFTGDWFLDLAGSSLVKTGAATAEFAFALDTNDLSVDGGVLRVGDGSTGDVSPFTVVNVDGGNLAINQAGGSVYESQTVVSSGLISFVGSGNLSVASATNSISGAGNQLFDRAGTVVVAMPNALGGTVTINSGTAVFDGNQEANRLAAGKLVTVNPGASMEIRGVNALPTGANSVNPALSGATLRVVSGGSVGAGATGTSHAHLGTVSLDASSVILDYSGAGGVYNGESFQLNGDLIVTGTGASTIQAGAGANAGNSGVALSNALTHTFSVADVAAGPDLLIGAELENSDAGAATSILAKTGPGTMSLTGGIDHSYSGTFQLDEGTLEATGSIAGPLLVAAPATIAPAGSFGVGGITLAGTYQCEIDGGASDRIAVAGDLAFSPGAQIQISVLGGGASELFYEIMSCTGAVSGPLPAVTGAPPGYALVQYSTSILLAQTGLSFQPELTAVPGSVETPLAGDDFNATNGGFTVSAAITPETDWTYTAGEWGSNGQATGFGGDNTSYLISPVFVLTKSGVVSLSFDHRYSFEVGYDGGALDVSVNGGPFTPVYGMLFSQNGYTGTLGDVGHSLSFQDAFVGNSPGHPAFITSECKLTAGSVGDTIQFRFISATDNNTVGNLVPPGWQIDSFTISEGGTGGLLLNWPVGVMQYSDTLQPPWTDLPGSGPAFIDTTLAPKRFFRIKE